jgi:hypothetical protein
MLVYIVRRLKGSLMIPTSANDRVAPLDQFARSACLPVRDEADGIAAMMLPQLVEALSCRAAVVLVGEPATAVIDLIEQCKPDVIFISATPPTATMHARCVVRRLRCQFPEMPLLVGLWHAQGDLSKAKERISGGKPTRVVPTLADGQEQIRLLIRRLVPLTAGIGSEPQAPEEGQELDVGKAVFK